MVRPFDLRDLALIRRLGERGVPLHTVSALAENLHPLRGALLNMLVGGELPTFVWKEEGGDRAGFVQLRVGQGAQAQILYISPRCEPDPDLSSTTDQWLTGHDCAIWLDLLDEAVAEVGQRGIHHVIAEIDEHSPELIILRRAGFAVYTRQDIWSVQSASFKPLGIVARPLIRRHISDDWDIQLLYANTVPRLVQLVESMPPIDDGENWVLRDGNALAAFLHVLRGSGTTWLRFFIHPDAEAEADEIVKAALEVAFASEPDVVYCCVRRYESWLPSALERSGFTVLGSQAVMVRHTVHQLPRVMAETSIAIEARGVSAPSTFVSPLETTTTEGRSEVLTGINGS